jgi:phosphoesterase RecJ-like protein
MRLKGRVYEKIETYKDDCICISNITRKDYAKTRAKEEETEGIVESLLAVDTVKVAVLLMEEENAEIRCSFRAKDKFDVRRMAVSFGGGGHSQAAGAKVKGKTIDDLKKEILEYIDNNTFEG